MEMTTIDMVVGKKLLKKKGSLSEKERETLYKVDECGCEIFDGCKYVLLFFSANWCPPCE